MGGQAWAVAVLWGIAAATPPGKSAGALIILICFENNYEPLPSSETAWGVSKNLQLISDVNAVLRSYSKLTKLCLIKQVVHGLKT